MSFFKTIFKNLHSRIWFIVTAVVLVLGIVINLVLTQVPLISTTFNNIFGFPQTSSSGDTSDLQYYTTSDGTEGFEYYDAGNGITSKTEALNAADAFNEVICEEGFVLLKNEEVSGSKALPLAEGESVSVFGKNSVNLVYGSSGSGGSDHSDAATLYDSLDAAGIVYNATLKSFYDDSTASGSGRPDNPSMESGVSTGIEIGETPRSSYTSSILESLSDTDTALVVISRIGGEGFDLPRTMEDIDGAVSEEDHYLELDQNEQDMLELACEYFDKVILLINSSTPVELGFLDSVDDGDDTMNDYDYASNIQGALWIGGPGNQGIMALGSILSGEVNPSGRLVDTYERDFSQSPTWQNFSTNFGNNKKDDGGFGDGYHKSGKHTGYYLVEYEEGIYVGYRYYETRGYTDGEDWYESQVVYPFGYGLSYTEFEWEIVGQTPAEQTFDGDTEFSIEVEVTNVGDVAGKDVVELYYTAPYTEGEIEKSQAELVGFEKTPMLYPASESNDTDKPNSCTVTIDFTAYDMASYDYSDANGNSFCGYELDAGEYTVSVRTNAHEVVDSVGYRLDADVQYPEDPVTGNTVENRFDDVSEGMSSPAMSRADWEGTFPEAPTYEERSIDDDFISSLTWKYANRDDESMPYYTEEMPVTGSSADEAEVMLYDLIGLDKDDPLWDDMMDQLSVSEMTELIGTGCYSTAKIERIDKPLTTDLDGPVGFVNFFGNSDVYDVCSYASECVIGATWNTQIAYEYGISIGNESLIGNEAGDGKSYSGWYAPGLNIHRSPFSGRNSEYFSEDGLLSGKMAAQEIQAATSMGLYTMAKHFVINDQETHRSSNGILTWANEQTIREIYFPSFQLAVQEGGSMGIMSSFNRIGTTWTGGSYELLTEVLRNEWGFKGMVISDFNSSTDYMNVDQMIRAGGDLNLSQTSSFSTSSDALTATQVSVIRAATKNVLYVIANSNAMNGHGEGVSWTYSLAPWVQAMLWIDAGVAAVLIVWGVFAIHGAYKKKKYSE